jgi:hypothetical protein
MAAGRLALERLLQGYGYEVTSLDVVDAYQHFVAAAGRMGLAESAARDATELANAAKAQPTKVLADALLRSIGGAAVLR